MRRASKVDSTQGAIVDALRKVGAWVFPLHAVGGGFPDLLCWNRGRYVLIECKADGDLNKLQVEFIATCPGEIHVCRTPDEALKAVIGKAFD